MKRARWNIGQEILLYGFLFFFMSGLVYAQEFPTKPINVIITFSPGGSADPSMRLLASKAEKFLGQPFMITNNGGGGGIRTPDPLRDSGFQDRRLKPDSATPPRHSHSRGPDALEPAHVRHERRRHRHGAKHLPKR